MAKVSQYQRMTNLSGEEELLGVQGTGTKVATLNDISDFAAVQAGAVTPTIVEEMFDVQRGIIIGEGVPLTLFKTSGNTWQEAWLDWVEFLDATGAVGTIPPGVYPLSGVSTYTIQSGITIRGSGEDMCVLDCSATPAILFEPGTMTRFSFQGATTRNCGLLNGSLGGPVSLIEVRNWDYECGLERPFFVNSNFAVDGYTVDDLILLEIYGRGGICGVQSFTAFKRANIDRVDVGSIYVPNEDSYYSDVGGTLNMLSRGFNGGLVVGYDSEDALELCEYLAVGTVVVDGVNDQRTKRSSGTTANCDGVKFHGCRNVTFNSITVKNVTSHYKSDTSGFYHKVINMTGGNLLIENAGHHEASWTVKGRYRSDSGPSTNSKGWNVDIKSVCIINTEGFVGRPAVYLSTEDIRVGTLYIEGSGGDVENPYSAGNRLSGTGGVVYTTASNSLSRLSIGDLQLVNCKVGSIVTNRLIRLDAYKDIFIGRIVIDGADNGGLFSTQSAGSEQNTRAVAVMASQAMEKLEIGSISVRNCTNNGKTMTALSLEGGASVDVAIIGAITIDGTVSTGILTSGTAVSLLQLGQGDISKATTAAVNFSVRPTELDLGRIKGVSRQMISNGDAASGVTTSWLNNQGTLSIASGVFKLARSDGNQGRAYQPITCEVGKFYTVSAQVTPGVQTPSNPVAVVAVGITAGSVTNAVARDTVSSARSVSLTFQATQTTHHVFFSTDPGSGTDGDYIEFNKVRCFEVGR